MAFKCSKTVITQVRNPAGPCGVREKQNDDSGQEHLGITMLNRIFPRQFDNNYWGHKLALWLFVPIVFMKVGISLSSIFAPGTWFGRRTALPSTPLHPVAQRLLFQ